jgi:hypothetical protein
VFVVAALLSMVPIQVWRYLVLFLACVHSVVFILTNLGHFTEGANNQFRMGVVVLTLVGQLFMTSFYIVKFY